MLTYNKLHISNNDGFYYDILYEIILFRLWDLSIFNKIMNYNSLSISKRWRSVKWKGLKN